MNIQAPHSSRSRRPAKICVPLLYLCLAGIIQLADAAPITNWTQSLGTTSSNLNTSSPTLGNGTADSANGQAIWAVTDSSYTLTNPGDAVTFSGLVTFAGIDNLNNPTLAYQYRFGLYNVNAQPSTTGWLGYFGGNSAGSSPSSLYERSNPNTGQYYSTTGATLSSNAAASANASFVSGQYSFAITVTRGAASSLNIAWSMTGLDVPYALSGTSSDATPQTFTFNRVGLTTGSSLSADQVSLSALSSVPEPAALAQVGLAAGLGLLAFRFRRKSS